MTILAHSPTDRVIRDIDPRQVIDDHILPRYPPRSLSRSYPPGLNSPVSACSRSVFVRSYPPTTTIPVMSSRATNCSATSRSSTAIGSAISIINRYARRLTELHKPRANFFKEQAACLVHQQRFVDVRGQSEPAPPSIPADLTSHITWLNSSKPLSLRVCPAITILCRISVSRHKAPGSTWPVIITRSNLSTNDHQFLVVLFVIGP